MLKYQTIICRLLAPLFLLIFSATLLLSCVDNTKRNTDNYTIQDVFSANYDVSQLDNSDKNSEIKYGYQIFQNTPKYIGSEALDINMVYTGNRLSCNNCHLKGGTKPYAMPLIGVIQKFPQYRGREDKIGTIEERINGCMERSMNGKMLPDAGKEIKAIIAYLSWLGKNAPKDGKIKGQGLVEINIPNRAVDLKRGKEVFNNTCVACHGTNGQGVRLTDSLNYQYPPLWGKGSYNNGAGMTRVITAAQFIKANMPFGTNYDAPLLTDEEAYDVAGYINQQSRPEKQNLEKDFPDLKKKPVSTPYPPFADSFSVEQHQLGPFPPIMMYYKTQYNLEKNK
ncbi:MAG: c-type cytochrome [Leeuwenhoekiella sp.]